MTKRYASVIGSGNCDQEIAELARELGAELARAGFVVVTGGLGGVMEAAARGANEAGGETIGVLPGDDRTQANRHSAVTVVSGVGWARNLAVVASGDVVVAVGGEWGTLSEIGHARQFGRPVVLLASWMLDHERALPADDGLHIAGTPRQAAVLARELTG